MLEVGVAKTDFESRSVSVGSCKGAEYLTTTKITTYSVTRVLNLWIFEVNFKSIVMRSKIITFFISKTNKEKYYRLWVVRGMINFPSKTKYNDALKSEQQYHLLLYLLPLENIG